MTTHYARLVPALAATFCLLATAQLLRGQEPPPPEEAPPSQEAAPSQAAPAPPPGEAPPAQGDERPEGTPPRLSYTHGEVSFWRPGAEDWAPAQINTALAPGDSLYCGPGGTLELQIGARAFVRAGANTQLGIENQEPDFQQFKVAAGHASLDLRSLTAGQTIELDTPNGAFSIEASGYYRIDITDDATTFITGRGGRATLTPPNGEPSAIAPSEQVVIEGVDNPRIETYAAPELDAWDRWNYERTDHLIDAVSARYVPPGVYGVDALDHYGTWRVTPNYGAVWVPSAVPAGWAPYSTGRWIWDPYYGWTWVDNAPWGWAPYHYGRWVNVTGYWAWAPGPYVAAPVYAPALVAFFGGPHFGVSIGIGAPAVGWVALGWGEPVVPWWGRPGFVGVPWWGGWHGPHVVNNVVIERTTIVNINNINVYQNVNVRNAVVATREDRFGRRGAEHLHVRTIDPHALEPVRGRVPVRPVSASLTPGEGRAVRPPERLMNRSVVATRAPHDTAAALRAEGLNVPHQPAGAPRIVAAPRVPHGPAPVSRPPFGQRGTTERARPPLPPRFGESRQAQPRQAAPQAAPAERARVPRQPAAPHGAPSAPAPAAVQRAPQAQQPAPRVPAPRAVEPRVPAPAPHAPAPSAPAPAQRQPAAPVQRAPHTLPGEPANRVYRAQPQPHGRSNQPAAPAPKAGGESAPRRPHDGGR